MKEYLQVSSLKNGDRVIVEKYGKNGRLFYSSRGVIRSNPNSQWVSVNHEVTPAGVPSCSAFYLDAVSQDGLRVYEFAGQGENDEPFGAYWLFLPDRDVSEARYSYGST